MASAHLPFGHGGRFFASGYTKRGKKSGLLISAALFSLCQAFVPGHVLCALVISQRRRTGNMDKELKSMAFSLAAYRLSVCLALKASHIHKVCMHA